MPCHLLSPNQELNWEPARSELRSLSPSELQTLIRSWLAKVCRSQLRVSGSCEGQHGALTFHAFLHFLPVPIGLRVRFHQRKSRLQRHHVDAFAGHLVRAGVSLGILITTGEIAQDASIAADAFRQPRLVLFSGEDWLAELAQLRLGLRPTKLPGWVLDLKRLFCDSSRCSHKLRGSR